MSPPAWIRTRSGSRSAWSRVSPRLTSRPWCRCGCSRSPSRAATRSSSSRRRRTRPPPCCSPRCGPRPGCRTACSTWCRATRWRWTPSWPIARYVYENGTAHGKRVQALGGAKNHMVVLPDADLDLAADAAVSAGFGSAGERCMAISVVAAVDPVGDELIEKIRDRVAKLQVGPGADERSEMGPLVTGPHRDKVAGYLDTGVKEGATLAIDGRVHPVIGGDPDGFWLGPSVLDHVAPTMSCYTDEIFGPVLCVVRVPSYESAVGLINGNPYGNGTAIFTNDG